MKFVLSLALIFVVSVPIRLTAQDAASAPFQPTASPRPESAPSAVRTESSSSPTTKSKPTPRPVATPVVRPKKHTSPVTKKTPAKKTVARETVDTSSSKGSGAGTIKSLENQWQNSIKNHDPSVIQEVIAEDFIGVSSSGAVGGKSALLYDAKRDKNAYRSVATRNLSVHNFGAHLVIVLGVTTETGTTAAGRAFSHSYRFTDTWMEREGKWQCVAAHAAVVPKR